MIYYYIYAFREYHYAQVELKIKANNENEAIDKAKQLVERDNYVVTKVEEE